MNLTPEFMRGYWQRIREAAGESDPPTWWDNLRARFYTGFWYGVFARTHTKGRTLPPAEEAHLVRAIMKALGDEDTWSFNSFKAWSSKYSTSLWVSNGRQFLHLEEPHSLPFRVWSQRRIYRRLRSVKNNNAKRNNAAVDAARALAISIQAHAP